MSTAAVFNLIDKTCSSLSLLLELVGLTSISKGTPCSSVDLASMEGLSSSIITTWPNLDKIPKSQLKAVKVETVVSTKPTTCITKTKAHIASR
jgi:hypothetical protein